MSSVLLPVASVSEKKGQPVSHYLGRARASPCENMSSGICRQRKPRSACASSNKIIGYNWMFEWRAKAWIIFCACAGWCECAHLRMLEGTFSLEAAHLHLSLRTTVDTVGINKTNCFGSVNQILRGWIHLVDFPPFCKGEKTFLTSCLPSYIPSLVWKGIFSKMKDFASNWSKFFPFNLDPFQMGGKQFWQKCLPSSRKHAYIILTPIYPIFI